MRRVALLHAYSARNRGDGLLVEESLALVREAVGDCQIVVAAADPDSFSGFGVEVLPSRPTRRGYDPDYLRFLRKLSEFDLVVGVGGGYLRAGFPSAMIKMSLVMLPQLLAAAQVGRRVVYLPQSIGPLGFGTARLLRRLLARLGVVFARDNRTVDELALENVRRVPDLAALMLDRDTNRCGAPNPRPVLTIRAVKGSVPANVYRLGDLLVEYDTYVQSDTGGNDDRGPTLTLSPVNTLTFDDFMAGPTVQPRVVVAMRLHAALMALRAGHYVVHLAYERKGYGAFEDLHLPEFVHHYRDFDPMRVAQQVRALASSSQARAEYDQAIADSGATRFASRQDVVEALRRSTR